LSALDIIHVDWDGKWLICAIAGILCCGFLVVCGLAWRLHRRAIEALCAGYLLVGFILGLHSAMILSMGFPSVDIKRQLAAAAIIALASFSTGIAIYRQIPILNDASWQLHGPAGRR
jgi:hypothetical protein